MMHKLVGVLLFTLLVPAWTFSATVPVLKGDTPQAVAARAKVPLEILRRSNPSVKWDALKAGAQVLVPDRHLVAAGETLYSLSKAWSTDASSVLAFNGLSATSVLKAGQVLFIPPTKARPQPVATPLPPTPAPTPSPTPTPAPVAVETFWPVAKPPHAEGNGLRSVTFATAGEPFRSVSAGTVVYVGEFRGSGRVLLVEDAQRIVYGYGNFEAAAVSFGQTVAKGQVLGTTSARNGQKLSFFGTQNNEPVDLFHRKR